ncbi:MAG: hypothetical protein ACSHYB_08820 [Roseibacillus sp.]
MKRFSSSFLSFLGAVPQSVLEPTHPKGGVPVSSPQREDLRKEQALAKALKSTSLASSEFQEN